MDSEDNISATKVIQAIKDGNVDIYKKMMHRKTFNMFKELQGIFK